MTVICLNRYDGQLLAVPVCSQLCAERLGYFNALEYQGYEFTERCEWCSSVIEAS